jgi:hypothetical protein
LGIAYFESVLTTICIITFVDAAFRVSEIDIVPARETDSEAEGQPFDGVARRVQRHRLHFGNTVNAQPDSPAQVMIDDEYQRANEENECDSNGSLFPP